MRSDIEYAIGMNECVLVHKLKLIRCALATLLIMGVVLVILALAVGLSTDGLPTDGLLWF